MGPSNVKGMVCLRKVLSVKYDAMEYFTSSATNVHIYSDAVQTWEEVKISTKIPLSLRRLLSSKSGC